MRPCEVFSKDEYEGFALAAENGHLQALQLIATAQETKKNCRIWSDIAILQALNRL